VRRILLTGISGVGKSGVVAALSARGYTAVDADRDEYSEWIAIAPDAADEAGPPVEPTRDWVWREDRVRDLLATEGADLLFLAGAAPNMRAFLPQFHRVILLTAPAEVIAERLATRTTNSYGKRPEEAARVLAQIETVEPLLRRIAHAEIDTSAPLDAVVASILRLALA
jgi:dephospho-CoA kinase